MEKNLIIILVDGGRLDFAQNSKIFQNLKTKSIFFSHAITYAPYTTAAMHAVLSGCYGNRTGVNSYWNVFKFKNNQFLTLADYLSEHNYYTYADGHTKLIIPKFGFDEFNIHDEEKIDLTEWHSELLEKMKLIYNNGKNFFLYLHYSKIHTGIRNEVLKTFNNFSKEYFENKDLNYKRYSKLFKNAEIYLDSIMKKIIDLDLLKNSIILILSDHGISIGEKFGECAYGAFCYDYTLRTFTYFLSEEFTSSEVTQQIRTVDFMPTILDYLGIPFDNNYEKLDGVSLIPLVHGESISEQIAYSETGNPLDKKEPPKEPNTKSVRTSKWKLILNQYDDSRELYNLELDPNEEKNLFGRGEKTEPFLWEKLEKLMKVSD